MACDRSVVFAKPLSRLGRLRGPGDWIGLGVSVNYLDTREDTYAGGPNQEVADKFCVARLSSASDFANRMRTLATTVPAIR